MSAASRSRATPWLVAGTLLAAMAAQMISAIPHASAVVDEPAHLTAGYLWLVRGDRIVNREHPPLVKALAALPLLAVRPSLPATEGSHDRASEDFEFDYSRRFLFESNDADALLYRARLPIVALTLVAGAVLFVWARTLFAATSYPLAAPATALALFCFEPNLLAHGRLVTTDMGASLFALSCFACLERGLAAPPRAGRWWACGAGACLGLALLSRFSSLLLLPLLAASLVLDRRRPASVRALHAGVALVLALLLVNAAYGFTGSLFPLAHAPIGGPLMTQPLAGMEVNPALRWTPLPLPRLYIEGIDLARHKNRALEGPGYLNGRYSSDGWWSYFVQALAMKCTLPMLALALVGIVAAVWRKGGPSTAMGLYAVLPALGLLFLMTALTRAQIGLRYVLPVIPWLCLAGAAWLPAWTPAGVSGRWARAVVAALLVWHVGAALAIHPYHLAYFNEASGGPDEGYRHLVDSNLDWGQDLVGLARYLKREGVARANLYYFGTADPAYYGLQRATPPEPGYFAVSATHLMGVYLPDHDYLAEFRSMRPVATIGHSIRVYRLDQVPTSLKRR